MSPEDGGYRSRRRKIRTPPLPPPKPATARDSYMSEEPDLDFDDMADPLSVDPNGGGPASGITESISPHNDHTYCIKTTKPAPVAAAAAQASASNTTTTTESSRVPLVCVSSSDSSCLSHQDRIVQQSAQTPASSTVAANPDCDDLSELKNKFRIQLEHRLFEKSPSSSTSNKNSNDSGLNLSLFSYLKSMKFN